MISMSNLATQAVQKLEKGKKGVSGQKALAMKEAVFAALKDFCVQDEEFAQAVMQGGSFGDCMKKVAASVGNSISDLDAYKKAVQFYFPGAEVKMQLTIDLIVATAEAEESEPVAKIGSTLILNLEDFF